MALFQAPFANMSLTVTMCWLRLDRLEQRMDELAREMRALTWKMMTLMVGVVGVVVAAVRL